LITIQTYLIVTTGLFHTNLIPFQTTQTIVKTFPLFHNHRARRLNKLVTKVIRQEPDNLFGSVGTPVENFTLKDREQIKMVRKVRNLIELGTSLVNSDGPLSHH